MRKDSYKPGERLEEAANQLFAHLDELAAALKSIKSVFPGTPTLEPGESGESLAWAQLEQSPRNLMIMMPGWSMPQPREQLAPEEYQHNLHIVVVPCKGNDATLS